MDIYDLNNYREGAVEIFKYKAKASISEHINSSKKYKTQKDLCENLEGISPSWLSSLIDGKIKGLINNGKIKTLCEELLVEDDYFNSLLISAYMEEIMSKFPCHVLYVDDEEHSLNATKKYLEKLHKIKVSVALDAMKGLNFLTKNHDSVTVVLSDIAMPNESGVVFLSKVKNEFPDISRMVITGHANLNNLQEMINSAHIYKCLMKPIDPSVLASQIDEAQRYFIDKKFKLRLQEADLL